jgi:hypothetical protein
VLYGKATERQIYIIGEKIAYSAERYRPTGHRGCYRDLLARANHSLTGRRRSLPSREEEECFGGTAARRLGHATPPSHSTTGPPPCSTSAPPGRTTGAWTRWSRGGCKSEERSGLCAALESHRAASPEPGTMPDDAPSRTPPTAKPVPRAEPPRLARATSHPEPRPLTGLPELETLAGEHRHHQLSYCVVGAALRSSLS